MVNVKAEPESPATTVSSANDALPVHADPPLATLRCCSSLDGLRRPERGPVSYGTAQTARGM